jgi:hypothetical protein
MFTTDVANDLQKALGADQDFAQYARYFHSTVLLVCDEDRLLVAVDGGTASCDSPTDANDADIVLSAPLQAWERLASRTEVNATLTRMLREGDLTIEGDVDRAMHQWRSLVWIVARLREVLSGITEF